MGRPNQGFLTRLVVCLIALQRTESFAFAPIAKPRRNTALRATTTLTPKLLEELNELPVFVHCNEQGNPLEYERDGKPLALCYADCGEAQEALAQNRKAYPGLGLRLVAIGLGDAYERKAAGGAVVVPGSAALDAARNPSGEAWDDGTIPLFGCLQMTMPNAYGETVCPLFMCPDDAERAVGNAKPPTQQPGDDPAGFDLTIVCISLDRALDLVTRRSAGAVGFQFVPPAASVAWLQNGRPGGEVEAGGGPPVTPIPGTNWGIRG